mgnify:CR=1 FL=1
MKQFLVVDDSFTIREMVTACIQAEDKVIAQAEDGVEALALAKATNFDFIITDNNMPNMDGLTLIEELRKLPEYQNTPILMLSTESDPNLKQRGKDAGVTGWILKPINQVTFSAIVEKVIDKFSH